MTDTEHNDLPSADRLSLNDARVEDWSCLTESISKSNLKAIESDDEDDDWSTCIHESVMENLHSYFRQANLSNSQSTISFNEPASQDQSTKSIISILETPEKPRRAKATLQIEPKGTSEMSSCSKTTVSFMERTASARLRNKHGFLFEDVCPICLSEYTRPIGYLQCNHEFCFKCLKSWADTSTVCPCCRHPFEEIIKRQGSNQERIHVKPKQASFKQEDYFTCYHCNRGDDQHVLLICDSCDFYGCHIYCDEGLNNTIPDGDWYCRYCEPIIRASLEMQQTPLRQRRPAPRFTSSPVPITVAQRTRSKGQRHSIDRTPQNSAPRVNVRQLRALRHRR